MNEACTRQPAGPYLIESAPQYARRKACALRPASGAYRVRGHRGLSVRAASHARRRRHLSRSGELG